MDTKTDMLYWEDGHRYFDDIDNALEYFFDEPDAEIPDTLQPCKPVECTEQLAERLADEVIDYIGDNVPELSCDVSLKGEKAGAYQLLARMGDRSGKCRGSGLQSGARAIQGKGDCVQNN